MAKPPRPNWPQLLIDGSWDTFAFEWAEFPMYIRPYGSGRQIVIHARDSLCWQLYCDFNLATRSQYEFALVTQGDLSDCLEAADTLEAPESSNPL